MEQMPCMTSSRKLVADVNVYRQQSALVCVSSVLNKVQWNGTHVQRNRYKNCNSLLSDETYNQTEIHLQIEFVARNKHIPSGLQKPVS